MRAQAGAFHLEGNFYVAKPKQVESRYHDHRRGRTKDTTEWEILIA